MASVRVSQQMTARRPGAGPLLRMRDYIYNSLYDSNGYFQAGTGPVLPRLDNAPSLFSELPNQKAYHEMVAARFRQKCSMGNHVHGWLTPVELFSPFLSRAIANRIVRQHGDPNQPLHVVEIGGGSGSLCSDILVRTCSNIRLNGTERSVCVHVFAQFPFASV